MCQMRLYIFQFNAYNWKNMEQTSGNELQIYHCLHLQFIISKYKTDILTKQITNINFGVFFPALTEILHRNM